MDNFFAHLCRRHQASLSKRGEAMGGLRGIPGPTPAHTGQGRAGTGLFVDRTATAITSAVGA